MISAYHHLVWPGDNGQGGITDGQVLSVGGSNSRGLVIDKEHRHSDRGGVFGMQTGRYQVSEAAHG